MWVLRIIRGRMWRCVNLSDGLALHVSIDGPGVPESIVVPSTGVSPLPVALGPVMLEEKDA